MPGLLEESGIEAAEIWLQVGQQPTWERPILDCAWKGVDHCYDPQLITSLINFPYPKHSDSFQLDGPVPLMAAC
jgi:hypothetical protein